MSMIKTSRMISGIRIGHPNLKGSFLGLGYEFNLFNENSMKTFDFMVRRACPSDQKKAMKEKANAIEMAKIWKRRKDYSSEVIYETANKQGDWTVIF